VALHVLVKVAFLCEAQLTTCLLFKWTAEGTFPSVNPEVVIEVVELPKELAAAFVVTLEDLEVTLGLWVAVLKNSEAAREGL